MNRLTYAQGMEAPMVSGRKQDEAKFWDVTVTLRYENKTEVVEFVTPEPCTAYDIAALENDQLNAVFKKHGHPEHYKVEARSR